MNFPSEIEIVNKCSIYESNSNSNSSDNNSIVSAMLAIAIAMRARASCSSSNKSQVLDRRKLEARTDKKAESRGRSTRNRRSTGDRPSEQEP